MSNKKELIPAYPEASCMLEALRGLGYTPESAIADIIDNSISANATEIHIDNYFPDGTDIPNVVLAITDDGDGMTRDELIRALSPGVIDPSQKRGEKDLGRFGMGLKTASLSQCKRLTVFSRKNSEDSCFCWDLDLIKRFRDHQGWNLFPGKIPNFPELKKTARKLKHGTIVIWEKNDKFCPAKTSEDLFGETMDRIENYICLYFHRFLEGMPSRIKLYRNGKLLKPINPFLPNTGTVFSPEQPIGAGVIFQSFILPHKDKLSKADYERGQLLNGWKAHQGFYVYRNDRLLQAGGWLGLGKFGKERKRWIKDELHQLVRIRLDITNSLDSEWNIDIKKSTATPPPAIRRELTRLAEYSRKKGHEVYAFRGGYTQYKRHEHESVWDSIQSSKGISYRINKGHPLVSDLLKVLGDEAGRLKNLLSLIEDTVPVQKICFDSADGSQDIETGMATWSDTQREEHFYQLFCNWDMSGYPPDTIRKILETTMPFLQWPALIEKTYKRFLKERG
ncbi:MAG: ATP-binding protein [Thermoguttaceae bacterium]|nr:ATP-binding protein [Thermoguttaceae bacterium]